MLKLPYILTGATLALISLSAFSQQEMMTKMDSSYQAPVGIDLPVAPPPPKQVIINNDSATENANREVSQSRDIVQGGSATRPHEAAAKSEFQKFIANSSGKDLSIFGADFFASGPSTFTPVGNAPVPLDYRLGAGDELLIRGWGSVDIDYRATIDRNGLISLPTVGSIVLAGVRAGDAEEVVRGAISRLYKGVTVNVNFGKLRAITIYVVGQARRPGTYTVSSLSTLVTAVFASGGPNVNGSMRRIQIKRGGKVAAELDLYSFIAKGDKSADVKLSDGDTIYIPPAFGHVALMGKVNVEAIYELSNANDSVASLLEFAGGLPVVADPRRVFLERIDVTAKQPRTVEQFALDEAALRRSLKNGDVLNITSITPDFSNAVVLRGNVDQPARAPFKPGMRVSDLIPSRDYLLTRSSIERQNRTATGVDEERENEKEPAQSQRQQSGKKLNGIASRIGNLIDEINWEYAVIERINRSDLTVSLIPFNLGEVFSNPSGAANVALQPGDTVTIFSQKDVAVPLEKRRVFVRVEGEVNVPGVYQMAAGETLQSLLARAGGPTPQAYLLGTSFYREQTRIEQEANLEKAVAKLETQLQNEQAKRLANARGVTQDVQQAETMRLVELDRAKENVARFRQMRPMGRIALGLDSSETSFSMLPPLKLQNGDRLVVAARPDFVHIFGAVNVEASPLWRRNGRVSDYLQKAGTTIDADIENVFIIRIDGSVISRSSSSWGFGGMGGVLVMPGDTIVVPEKIDRETAWTKFTKGTREWAQIFANFGLGAAAIKVLKE